MKLPAPHFLVPMGTANWMLVPYLSSACHWSKIRLVHLKVPRVTNRIYVLPPVGREGGERAREAGENKGYRYVLSQNHVKNGVRMHKKMCQQGWMCFFIWIVVNISFSSGPRMPRLCGGDRFYSCFLQGITAFTTQLLHYVLRNFQRTWAINIPIQQMWLLARGILWNLFQNMCDVKSDLLRFSIVKLHVFTVCAPSLFLHAFAAICKYVFLPHSCGMLEWYVYICFNVIGVAWVPRTEWPLDEVMGTQFPMYSISLHVRGKGQIETVYVHKSLCFATSPTWLQKGLWCWNKHMIPISIVQNYTGTTPPVAW